MKGGDFPPVLLDLTASSSPMPLKLNTEQTGRFDRLISRPVRYDASRESFYRMELKFLVLRDRGHAGLGRVY